MKTLLALLLVLLTISGSSYAADSGWQLIGQRDIYRIIVVAPDAVGNKAMYWNALRDVCSKKNYCNVAFFSEDKPLASVGHGRLTEEDVNRALLIYTIKNGFRWNCQLTPDADNCFKR